MQTFYASLAGVHILTAFLILLAFLVAQFGKRPGVPPVMLWAARVQLLLGLVIVGVGEGALDMSMNHAKVGVKLLVALAVVACLEIAAARQRKGKGRPALVLAAFWLTVLNTGVAFFWG